jgi:hypothetical protein
MRPGYHAVISLGLGALVAYGFRSWMAGILCFVVGIFIDIDHHLDFYLVKKKFPFRFSDLDDHCRRDVEGKLYLIFHSYEFLFLGWMAICYFRLNEMWLAAALSASVHIICDQLVNPLKPLAYFFVYRLSQGFERKRLFVDGHFQDEF